MHPPAPNSPETHVSPANALSARQTAWSIAALLLIALTVVNVGMVMLTLARFSLAFMLSNGINVLLVWGLNRTKSWARYGTIAWELIGIGLALAVAVQTGATSDLFVTVLLQGGILVPLVGPPHKAKNAIGILLFVFGFSLTVYALLTQRVVVR
jgi:hypothetical protein